MDQCQTDKPLLAVLSGHSHAIPPVWMMRQAGRYLPEYRELRARAGSFLDLCFTPVMAAEATLQPIRRFQFDAAILFSDILVIPHALGRSVRFEAGEGPRLEPLTSPAEIARLRDEPDAPTLAPVYEALRLIKRELDPAVTLIGFCGAPWTVATYMVAGQGTPDQAPARLLAYREPDAFARLIEILVAATVRHLVGQLQAGADVLQLFDTWAGILPPAEFCALVRRTGAADRRAGPPPSARREIHWISARRRRFAGTLCRSRGGGCRQHRLGGGTVFHPRTHPEPGGGAGQP